MTFTFRDMTFNLLVNWHLPANTKDRNALPRWLGDTLGVDQRSSRWRDCLTFNADGEWFGIDTKAQPHPLRLAHPRVAGHNVLYVDINHLYLFLHENWCSPLASLELTTSEAQAEYSHKDPARKVSMWRMIYFRRRITSGPSQGFLLIVDSPVVDLDLGKMVVHHPVCPLYKNPRRHHFVALAGMKVGKCRRPSWKWSEMPPPPPQTRLKWPHGATTTEWKISCRQLEKREMWVLKK